MGEIFNSSYLINKLFFNSCAVDDWIPGVKYAFFINSSVFDKCRKFLKINLDHDVIWNFKLQVGNKFYDTKLIFLTLHEEETYDFLQNIVWSAQYTFPWEDQPILYKSSGLYHKLEEFIGLHYSKSDIEKIEEIESVSDDGVKIKVITFASYIDKTNLIEKYRKFIMPDYSDQPNYYYFTSAFPWYQQKLLEHFEIPLANEQINTIFPIILRHLYYSDAINIFDLIAIKLAICDFRNSHHSNLLKGEIDTLIQLTLQKMATTKTYIKNNVFDLVQYSMDRNFIPNRSCILYFVYTFQNYFNSVKIVLKDDTTPRSYILVPLVMPIPIMLTEQFDEIRKIRGRSNIKFKINGIGFDRMTISLFLDLLEHDNVEEIIFDTNFAWMTNDEPTVTNKKYQFNDDSKIKVKFVGSNPFDFIEEFFGFLKTFKHSNKLILLVFCPLRSYIIFDNLEVDRLELYNTYIDHKLLDELTRCNLKIKSIAFQNCTLENKVENWELMISNIPELTLIVILEDEGTWQFLFEYITKCLINSNLREFKFSKDVYIKQRSILTDLHDVLFTMDENHSKLLIKSVNNEQFIDLYELKNVELFNDIDDTDYDFYQ